MNTLHALVRHPAGRMGLLLGVTFGLLATIMGEGSKALLFVGICRLISGRFGR